MGFIHARTFDTRWGLVLAFIDIDDATDVEVLRIQLWAPVGSDGDDGKVAIKIGLNPEASDEAHDRMAAANRDALVNMDASRIEKMLETAGVGQMLDGLLA